MTGQRDTNPEMAENPMHPIRSPEAITITVIRARNLRGLRGDAVCAQVKVEFGEKVLGESPKVDCTAEAPAEFNYNATYSVTFDDPISLDEVALKPVIMTVTEILPKEKKQKEEKTQALGQVSLDLFPLAQGETSYNYTLEVNALPGSPLETLAPDLPKPELDVKISVQQPLLTEEQLNESNLVCVTLESLYSPPESWTLGAAQQVYTGCLPVPITAEKDNTAVFVGGQLKPGADKEAPNKQKRWAMPGAAQANSVFIPELFIPADEMDDEDGELKDKDDQEHRQISEQEKNRVTWNVERRCYLDSSGTKSFQEKIAKVRYWPVEVFRTAVPSGAKGKKEEEGHIGFHGVAYINLAPLLYPGVKRIRGAYKVYAFEEKELTEKTMRKGSLAEEALRIANGILNRISNSPSLKPAKKDEGKAKDTKKGFLASRTPVHSSRSEEKSKSKKEKEQPTLQQAPTAKAGEGTAEGEVPVVVNVEGQQYVEALSYITMEINLERPLVPKRPAEELAKRVAEYIPARPLFPKRTDGAQRAVSDFHSQVANVAQLVLAEFRENFGGQTEDMTGDSMEKKQQKLIYNLNTTGKYFAFKEQLKHSIVKIVREKYLKTVNFKDKDELQEFLGELYVYLVDEMHTALNKTLAIEDQAPVPQPLTDSNQLKHFAREAEVNGNFELATKYYQERIARDRTDPDHWLDYGIFCLYINDLTKAEECFKECISIDQRHLQGLLLYAIVCTMQDRNDAAEVFFEAATTVDPGSILAWTLLGLFYDGIGNEIGAEMAVLEANKINKANALALSREGTTKCSEPEKEPSDVASKEQETPKEAEEQKEGEEPLVSEERPAPENVPAEDTLALDASSNKDEISIEVPPVVQSSPTPTSQSGSATGRRDRKGSGMRKSGVGSRINSKENIASSRMGSAVPGAVPPTNVPEVTAPRVAPTPTQTIYMQTIEFLLDTKATPFAERALAKHLLEGEPLGGASAEYHIALARLYLQKQQLDEAEENLNRALQYDHQNSDAWAILGHVKYLMGDTMNAKDCYERTIAFINDASEMHSIYLRLASIYLQEGKFNEAREKFLMACKRTPSCVSWLGVGIACFRLTELSDAEDALTEANILNNSDPEVWAYLALVCLRTGRQFEAEQAYKYAIKLNLGDEELLNEIRQVQEEVGFGNPQL